MPQFNPQIENRTFSNSLYEYTTYWYQNYTKTQQKSRYRSVSLMNINAKNSQNSICTLNSRTHPKSIHHDQVDFIYKMHRWISICKSINLIHHINQTKRQKKRKQPQ